jgi:hypothetical protein
MLNRSGESGHPCLIPDFRENGFSFSPLSMMLAISLSYIAFIMSSYILSVLTFTITYHERMLSFVEGFFGIY